MSQEASNVSSQVQVLDASTKKLNLALRQGDSASGSRHAASARGGQSTPERYGQFALEASRDSLYLLSAFPEHNFVEEQYVVRARSAVFGAEAEYWRSCATACKAGLLDDLETRRGADQAAREAYLEESRERRARLEQALSAKQAFATTANLWATGALVICILSGVSVAILAITIVTRHLSPYGPLGQPPQAIQATEGSAHKDEADARVPASPLVRRIGQGPGPGGQA